MTDPYQPRPEHKFTFGLWTVGNPGRDPFGEPVRPVLSPVEIVHLLAEVGAYGVNFHDNDLVPIDATAAERDRIVARLQEGPGGDGLAGADGHHQPVQRSRPSRTARFTSNDARVRAYALQKTMRAIDLGVELGAKVYVFWGGREGVETRRQQGPARGRSSATATRMNFLTRLRQGPEVRPRVRARGQAQRAAPRHLPAHHGRDPRLHRDARPPRDGRRQPRGRARAHVRASTSCTRSPRPGTRGKLFHIDLNDQAFGRYDQDLRFGSHSLKSLLLPGEVPGGRGLPGQPPLRLARLSHRGRRRRQGLRARLACARYLIYKEKARRWNEDKEIQALVAEHQRRSRPTACRRSAPTARPPPTRSRATRSTARRSARAASATSGSTS